MNWVEEAKRIFLSEKPNHFTSYKHCEKCAEHDETLKGADIDSIGLEELGNPGWDPICFCTDEGKKYYIPSFIRLSLDTVANEFYLGQFLFHLEGDGDGNNLLISCNEEQKKFIASFVEYMINSHAKEIDDNLYAGEALKVYQMWSKA